MDLREGNLNDNYFICRVREFEKMYEMPWWEFFAFYQNNLESLPGYGGRASVDYSEWAFLCENFYTELTEIWCKPRNLNLLRKPAREIATISGDLFEKTVPKLLPPL